MKKFKPPYEDLKITVECKGYKGTILISLVRFFGNMDAEKSVKDLCVRIYNLLKNSDL